MRRRSILLGLAGGLAGCVSNDLELVSVSGWTIDNDTGWMNSAPLAEPFTIQISFRLHDVVYTDTRAPNVRDWVKAPLAQPDFPRRYPLDAGVDEVEGHVAELAAYYHRAKAAGISADTLYWLRLNLGGPSPDTRIGFAWWDTLSEFRQIFDWIEGDGAEPFDELEQGWRVQAARRGDELLFRQSDWERHKEFGKVRAPVGICAGESRRVWRQANRIVAALKRELGIDPWS